MCTLPDKSSTWLIERCKHKKTEKMLLQIKRRKHRRILTSHIKQKHLRCQTTRDSKVLKKENIKNNKYILEKLEISNSFKICNKIFTNIKPVFTNDSRHLLCASGRKIYIFERKTGLINWVFTKHTDRIRKIYINEKDPYQVISCSQHEIMFWDYVERTLAKHVKLTCAAKDICIETSGDFEYAYLKMKNKVNKKRKKREKRIYPVVKYGLKDGSIEEIGIANCINDMVIHSNGEYLAYISPHSELTIYMIKEGKKHTLKTSENAHYNKFSSIAFHPFLPTIATGHMNGNILIWHNWSSKLAKIRLHWHSWAVKDLLFSVDGYYLYSGGVEEVLVKWHLETNNKTFTPRMGGDIKYIIQSKKGDFLAITLETNMIKVISTVDRENTQSIKFLTQAAKYDAGLTYHSDTKCLVLNSLPCGVIQFYDPTRDSVYLSLDLVGENPIKMDSYGTELNPTVVKKIAFSWDGKWMATFLYQKSKYLEGDLQLKFWKKTEDINFVLNSMVQMPSTDFIHSLTFRPQCPDRMGEYSVVTTNQLGEIKLYGINDSEESSDVSWSLQRLNVSLRSEPQDNKRRHDVSFSQDGSVLAVLFDEITLWDPDSLLLEATLKVPRRSKRQEKTKSFCFGHGDNAHFLIGASLKYLIVWNLKTFNVQWMLECHPYHITADPYSKYFVSFCQMRNRKHLFLFDPSVPQPVALIRNTNVGRLRGTVFLEPTDPNDSNIWRRIGRLFFLETRLNEMHVNGLVANEAKEESDDGDDSQGIEPDYDEDTVDTYLEDIFFSRFRKEKQPELEERSEDVDVYDIPDFPLGEPYREAVRKMMTTPSHVLPSVEILSKAFYHSLLMKEENKEKEEVGRTGMEGDDEEGQDSDDDERRKDDKRSSLLSQSPSVSAHEPFLSRKDMTSSLKLRTPKVDFLLP